MNADTQDTQDTQGQGAEHLDNTELLEGEQVIVGSRRRDRMRAVLQWLESHPDCMEKTEDTDIERIRYVNPDHAIDRSIELIRIDFVDGHVWEFTRYRPTNEKGQFIG